MNSQLLCHEAQNLLHSFNEELARETICLRQEEKVIKIEKIYLEPTDPDIPIERWEKLGNPDIFRKVFDKDLGYGRIEVWREITRGKTIRVKADDLATESDHTIVCSNYIVTAPTYPGGTIKISLRKEREDLKI